MTLRLAIAGRVRPHGPHAGRSDPRRARPADHRAHSTSPAAATSAPTAAAFLGRGTGVTIGADLAALAAADVLIDFTRPEGTLEHLA